MSRRVVPIVAGCLLVAACGTQPRASDQPVEAPAPEATPATSAVTAASTVVPPTLPPPCVVPSMMFVPLDDGGIQVMNHAYATCELDLTGAPSLSPHSEPTVWIDSGGSAELVVEAADTCETPTSSLSLIVETVPVEVPLPTPMCDPKVVAIVPYE